MDNVTHTLIGIALGRAIPENDLKKQKAILWTAVIGNNLPDLDFLLKPFLGGGRLGYLLHHRGYTHTVLAAVPLGILAAFLGTKLARTRGLPSLKLFSLGYASVLLHIAADYCNNYGVHPFSPYFQSWFYGDFIFIIEPLILATLLPLAFFTSESRTGKTVSAALGITLFGLSISGIFMPWTVATGLIIWAIFFIWIQKKNVSSVLPAALGLFSILLAFWAGSTLSRTQISALLKSQSPPARSIQIVTTPSPSNPFCWSIITLSLEMSDYVARVGVLSLAPSLFSPSQCYFRESISRLVPLGPVSLSSFPSHTGLYSPSQTGLYWTGEFRRPLQEFEDLKTKYCYFRALLRFSRIPVWFQTDQESFAEDLRYDQGAQNGFTKVRLDANEACPEKIPFWQEPTHGIEDFR